MDINEIHQKLMGQCPAGYRINEIIPFSYPYRRLRIKATVNKSPEESIRQIYTVILRALDEGYSTETELCDFLGLQPDDFLLKELYFLRERGYTDFIAGNWVPTAQGREFIADNSLLQVLAEEEFEFMLDCITNEVLIQASRLGYGKKEQNCLPAKIIHSHKSPELLANKQEELAGIYNGLHQGKSQLVDYDKHQILFDKAEHINYYLIEYIGEGGEENEPYIEIRNTDKEHSLDKRLTQQLSRQYPTILYQLTHSERTEFALQKKEPVAIPFSSHSADTTRVSPATETLSVWQTQEKFKEALRTAKQRILIESPWIKKATLMYMESIKTALKRGVKVVILYGIHQQDHHDQKTLMQLEELQDIYTNRLSIIHLPTHFEDYNLHDLTGTHRKLLIKDDEYYIQGSFNFLSFNKQQGQKVANEESVLIRNEVEEKWAAVINDYGLSWGRL